MKTPFSTRGGRRVTSFVFLWMVCIVSIVVFSTAETQEDRESLLSSIGAFYNSGRNALNEFATISTLPRWIPLITYLVLALLLISLSTYILMAYTFHEYFSGPEDDFTALLMSVYLLPLVGVLLFFGFISGNNIVLIASPQLLVLSFFLLLISLITSFVP